MKVTEIIRGLLDLIDSEESSQEPQVPTKRRRVDLDDVDPVIDLTEDNADVAPPHSVAEKVLVEKERFQLKLKMLKHQHHNIQRI